MAIRYLIRRSKPEDLSDIRARVKNIDAELGSPGEGYLRDVHEEVSTQMSILYSFKTRKNATGLAWICNSIELVAENHQGLFALADLLKVQRPSHLTESLSEK